MSEDKKRAKVVSILSGKGGAGKTSVAIGISYMLNDAGFRVILIDFDLATNGASYFYKPQISITPNDSGICEYLNEMLKGELELSPMNYPTLFKVKEGLSFIPSRTNFKKQYPFFTTDKDLEKKYTLILKSFLDSFRDKADFIIIDNQAGSNLTSMVSASVSEKVIIVAEFDQISLDAVDTLFIQIGQSYPEFTRRLINKLDTREKNEYQNMTIVSKSMGFLPPLPFDFDVRAAFSSRKVPIDVSNPNIFAIALYNVIKALTADLPEYGSVKDSYGRKILQALTKSQARLESLIDEKSEIQKRIERHKDLQNNLKRKRSILYTMVSVVSVLLSTIISYLFLGAIDIKWIIIIISFLALAAIVLTGTNIYQYINIKRIDSIIELEKDEKRLNYILLEIERYESLKLTRTLEVLRIPS